MSEMKGPTTRSPCWVPRNRIFYSDRAINVNTERNTLASHRARESIRHRRCIALISKESRAISEMMIQYVPTANRRLLVTTLETGGRRMKAHVPKIYPKTVLPRSFRRDPITPRSVRPASKSSIQAKNCSFHFKSILYHTTTPQNLISVLACHSEREVTDLSWVLRRQSIQIAYSKYIVAVISHNVKGTIETWIMY